MISVVIPVLNGERTIGAQLAALRDHPIDEFEVVVADNGSSDGTADVVESFTDSLPVRLVDASPALLLVDAAPERVHDRVQVGADPQPEKGDVVGGVADHGDLRVGDGSAQPAQEAGGTDAAGGNHDMHAAQSGTATNRWSERLNITVRLDFTVTTRV